MWKGEEMKEKKRLRLDENGMPYAICPECHERIYYIEAENTITDIIYPSNKDKLEWEAEDFNIAQQGYCFLCPKCHKEIAEDEYEILELFLE